MPGSNGLTTASLSEFASSLRFEDLPREVVDRVGRCVLDWLGLAVRGSREPLAAIIHAVVRSTGTGGAEKTPERK